MKVVFVQPIVSCYRSSYINSLKCSSEYMNEYDHCMLIISGLNALLLLLGECMTLLFLTWLTIYVFLKGVLHPWTLFVKTLCIFSKNTATVDKVSYGSGQNVPRNNKIMILLQQRSLLWSYSKRCVKISIFHVLINKSINPPWAMKCQCSY